MNAKRAAKLAVKLIQQHASLNVCDTCEASGVDGANNKTCPDCKGIGSYCECTACQGFVQELRTLLFGDPASAIR